MRRPALRPQSVRGRLATLSAIGALVLASATGFLLFRTLGGAVTDAIDDGLSARADDIETSLAAGDLQLAQEEAFAQVMTPAGELFLSSATIGRDNLVLTPEEVAVAAQRETVFEREVDGLGGQARLLARPARLNDADTIIMVGASSESAARAETRLRTVLALTVPILALLLGVAAWWVAGRALAPAERMARQAERISLTAPGRRLTVPPKDHELADLGRSLNAMLERIENAYEHERAFLDDASHELRTPLSILRGELELTLDELGDEASASSVRSALEETDRLAAITSDLLTLARADNHNITLDLEPVNLRLAAEAARDRLSRPEERVFVEVVGKSVKALADKRSLEQVLVNLLSNARRHARERVLVTIERHQRRAVVEVADDGPGFDPELLPRVFERFSRADDGRSRRAGGTGLGLAIAKALTEAQGGELAAHNGLPLGGAVIELSLPRR